MYLIIFTLFYFIFITNLCQNILRYKFSIHFSGVSTAFCYSLAFIYLFINIFCFLDLLFIVMATLIAILIYDLVNLCEYKCWQILEWYLYQIVSAWVITSMLYSDPLVLIQICDRKIKSVLTAPDERASIGKLQFLSHSILYLIPRTTVTSLRAPKFTRCKTHPLCVNPGVPFWTRELTHKRARWQASSSGIRAVTSRLFSRWDKV